MRGVAGRAAGDAALSEVKEMTQLYGEAALYEAYLCGWDEEEGG